MRRRQVVRAITLVVLVSTVALAVGTAAGTPTAGTPASGTLAVDPGDANTADDNFTVTIETPSAIIRNASQNYTISVDGADGNVSATWTFENESKRGTAVSHEFADAGNATIEVVVEDERGATVTKTLTVEVPDYDVSNDEEQAYQNLDVILMFGFVFGGGQLIFVLFLVPKAMQVLSDAI